MLITGGADRVGVIFINFFVINYFFKMFYWASVALGFYQNLHKSDQISWIFFLKDLILSPLVVNIYKRYSLQKILTWKEMYFSEIYQLSHILFYCASFWTRLAQIRVLLRKLSNFFGVFAKDPKAPYGGGAVLMGGGHHIVLFLLANNAKESVDIEFKGSGTAASRFSFWASVPNT